jgi:hypothetical protein
MVISRLNIPRVQENLSLIGSFLEKLGRLAKLSQREFLVDERNPAAAESFLRRSIEAMFDISRHILSKSYEFKKPGIQGRRFSVGSKESGLAGICRYPSEVGRLPKPDGPLL